MQQTNRRCPTTNRRCHPAEKPTMPHRFLLALGNRAEHTDRRAPRLPASTSSLHERTIRAIEKPHPVGVMRPELPKSVSNLFAMGVFIDARGELRDYRRSLAHWNSQNGTQDTVDPSRSLTHCGELKPQGKLDERRSTHNSLHWQPRWRITFRVACS